ncbi:MAG: electron transport complex subunit RsxC [Clostridiales bacterium]|nr:electron transport complex subunit RsxC [Clostridiales bacterium]
MKQYKYFKRGVKVPHYKNTENVETTVMPIPDLVEIPMLHHIGAPCEPLVKPGDEVLVGQKIGDSDKYISAPVHTGVSGKVKKINSILFPNGVTVKSVLIETDKKQVVDQSIKPPVINSKKEFIAAVRESGLVGLGGAGFPTHVKLNPPEGIKIEYLLINGAECEPYITSDYRESIENSWNVISGINIIMEYLEIDKVIIGIEDNKPKAVEVLTGIAKTSDKIDIMPLKSKYPQGAEKMLIYSLTGKVVPAGKLPLDVGVIVMNVTSVAFIASYIKTGMPLTKKRITIDGGAIKHPSNIEVFVGTNIKEAIKFAGGFKEEPKKILMGGPMMGVSQYNLESPILKQNNAILAFNEKQSKMPEQTACIKCGRCISACPMNLMPVYFDIFNESKDADQLLKLDILSCIECGSCSFVCPANRYLVQSIRNGKLLVRAKGSK